MAKDNRKLLIITQQSKSKRQWDIISHLLEWLLLKKKKERKKTKENQSWQGCGEKIPLWTVGGNVTWRSLTEDGMEGPQKIHRRTTVRPRTPVVYKPKHTSGHWSKIMETRLLRYLYCQPMAVLCSRQSASHRSRAHKQCRIPFARGSDADQTHWDRGELWLPGAGGAPWTVAVWLPKSFSYVRWVSSSVHQ